MRFKYLEELESEATPVPWIWSKAYGTGFIHSADDTPLASAVEYLEKTDAQLIVNLRNAWPKIKRLVEACQKSHDECHGSCASWNGSDDCDCGYVERSEALTDLEA